MLASVCALADEKVFSAPALQRAAVGAECRAARVGVVPRQRQRAGAALGERAGAADVARKDQVVAAVDCEHAVVEDITHDRAAGAVVAELQRARADRRAACVGVVPCQRQRAGPSLGERAAAADDAGIGQRVVAVEDERGVVDDVPGDAAGVAGVADLQRARADRRIPRVGVVRR